MTSSSDADGPGSFPPPDPATAVAEPTAAAGDVRRDPPAASPPPTADYQPRQPPPGDQTGQYASFAPRVAAFAIDTLIAVGLSVAVWIAANYVVRYLTFFAPATRVFAYGTMIGVWLFQAYVQGETGQTIGKRMVGTRLVHARTREPIGPGPSVKRALLHTLDLLPCGFGFFQVMWHTRRQTFADVLSHSIVVHS